MNVSIHYKNLHARLTRNIVTEDLFTATTIFKVPAYTIPDFYHIRHSLCIRGQTASR